MLAVGVVAVVCASGSCAALLRRDDGRPVDERREPPIDEELGIQLLSDVSISNCVWFRIPDISMFLPT